MTRPSRLARFGVVAMMVSLLAACATSSTGDPSAESLNSRETLRVVTSTTQVTDFTREVAGDTAEVYPLLQANQTAHSFDPSAKDLVELKEAAVFVINGRDLESWVSDAIAASGFSGLLVDASARVTPLTRDGVVDPHVWTDPANAILMTEEIRDGLSRANPSDSSIYESNAARYIASLRTLNDWIETTVNLVPPDQRLLVTNHDAFTYFVAAYDITLVGSIIPEFDDNAEPSAADIDSLVERIRDSGVRAIFAESSISPKLAETVARETGITVYSGDDSLYSDTLGALNSGASTYISATIHNVTRLAQSWGVVAPPVPAELAQ